MNQMSTKTNPTPSASAPLFVPKSESNVVEITCDDAIRRIMALREQMAPFEKQEKNLIEVVKAHMKAKNEEKHTTPEGVTAQWSTSQESKIDKELAKELLGENWARVHSFKPKRSFTIK
jgi:restriction endonuclease